MTWRNLCFVLAALCAYQAWRGCQRTAPPAQEPTAAECAAIAPQRLASNDREPTAPRRDATDDDRGETPAMSGFSINGFKLPAWTAWFAPHPGENLLDYRDRMLPLAQAAVAPHRARVARGRDDFAKLVSLDAQQRAQLDAGVQEAATAIQDKVMGALMSGDLMPSSFKPMTGVSLARDVLDAVDQANRRFVATLREDQKAQLAKHPFDFADYLLFSARWEDALGVTQ